MTLIREVVLDDHKIEKNGISIKEIPFVGKLNLRGNQKDKDFLSNAGSILNTLIPLEPNTSNNNNDLTIIWLGPNEWLILIDKQENYINLLTKLELKLDPKKTAVTDISENRTILQIKGKNLLKLLSKFMVLDLDKALKKESSVAQTIFVKIPILIIRNHNENEEPSVSIHVNRSHTKYLYNLLIDGTKNFNF